MASSSFLQQTPSLAEQVSATKNAFLEAFGRPSQWVVAAPGRVNLIGEHTDYNGGYVFPLAIERYVVIAAGRADGGRPGSQVRALSTLLNQQVEFRLDALAQGKRDWSSYVRGAFAGCIAHGLNPGALDIVIDSQVPLGGGLSSSAALEVATATLVEAVCGRLLDPVDKARLCQKAEHEYAGMPCGIMDQFSSALGEAGRLLLIDCRTETAELVPLNDPGVAVLVINSNVKHELTGSEYAERRSQCEAAARALGVATLRDVTPEQVAAPAPLLEPVLLKRARHVVSEIERTVQAAAAMRAGEWRRLGDLMYASHRSLRDDYEVSCAELDVLVELAAQIGMDGGVFGSRMTGGGFGGCTVSLVRARDEAVIAERIGRAYQERTGIGATAFVTKPARGAYIVEG